MHKAASPWGRIIWSKNVNSATIKRLCFIYSQAATEIPMEILTLYIHNFIYLPMAVLGLRCCVGFSLVVVNWGCSLAPVVVLGFSLPWLLLLQSTASRCEGFSSCGSLALENELSSCGTGLVALRHVGSSRITNWTCVSCIGRQILHQGSPDSSFFFFNQNSKLQMFNSL